MVGSTTDVRLAHAKISRPSGNRPIPRPRLFSQLDEMRSAPVIWLAGPPGAGKTTLVSHYLAERALANLWLQLDADDADVARFFHYLGLAARQAGGPGGAALPTLTPAYSPSLPSLPGFTRRFAEALAERVQRPTLIVLDNYEQVPADAALHEVVRDLASALAPGLGLVVLSRAEPPPVFARMRLHEQLRLLDGQALQLSREEADDLVARRNPHAATPADPARTERLLFETQGWFAGFTLLLSEGSLLAGPACNARTQQLLFDYFATELFGNFDPAQQAALLRIALLPSMTVAAAEWLSGHPGAGQLLADLHRQNCFVVLREQAHAQHGPQYEFHALFRAFLLSRAAAHIPAGEWRVLQCQAADLLAEANQADAAAELYRAATAWDALAALALREASSLIAAGCHHTLSRWLNALPEDCFQRLPWLSHWQAMALLPFDAVAARGIFERAYQGLQRDEDAAGLYATWAGAMESFFYEWRDFRLADPWIAEFERLRARHPEFPSRAAELRTYWAMGTLVHRQPQHPLLPAWSVRALALLDLADRDLSVLIGGYLVIWLLWRGETAKSQEVITRISPWITPDMSPVVAILWCCALGLHHSVQGASDDCREAVTSGLALAERTGLHAFDFMLSAQMARCSLVAGDLAEADTWMSTMAGAMRSHSHIDGAFYQHLQCNAAAQRGSWQLALAHARGAMAMAAESGVPFVEAHCHLDLARALREPADAVAWAAHVHAARAIGQAMGSPVIEYHCLEVEAVAAFAQGREGEGLAHLARALALSHAMGGATWQMAGPQLSARLYDRALVADLEPGHVQRQIRRLHLVPPEPATAAEAWPWPVRIYTLGRFEVLCDDQPLRASGKTQHKPLALLKCLCAFGGQAVNQDRVTDALWPDTEGDAADQVLRTTLHRLRKLLRHEEAVRLEDHHLHLDPRCLWADCLAFERAAHHPALADPAGLRQALLRYRGPFLDGESAPWALACRERLQARFMRLSERLGLLLEQGGDWDGAVDCYRHATTLEPLAEDFHRRLMKACIQLGRRPEAIAAYQRCRQVLLSRQGISPSLETQALYRQLTGS